MAIARPVRVLGLAAIFMWCFFIWQIFSPSVPYSGSDSPIYERDPNLDRTSRRPPAPSPTAATPR